MPPTRDTIVEHLQKIVGADRVVTDERALRESSIDNFRKLQKIFDVYTMPMPAAVAFVQSTDEVAQVLAFADAERREPRRPHRRHGDRGRLGNARRELRRRRRLADEPDHRHRRSTTCRQPCSAACRCRCSRTRCAPSASPRVTRHSRSLLRRWGAWSPLAASASSRRSTAASKTWSWASRSSSREAACCRIKNVPRRAAGPDIRHIVIGNEGALCFITEVTVKLFAYRPENNTFLGWTLKSMKTGFEALREVMVAGYKPSVARLYDPEDGQLHFSGFAAPDDCVLLFMAEGPAGIAKATADGIVDVVSKFDECKPVESRQIAEWFDDLVWGADKIAREDERIRTTRNVNRTTEVAADWSSINDIYENAVRRIRSEIRGITLLGGHSSHSYINGTNMYFNYFYDIDCPPEEENEQFYFPIISIICEETLRFGGSIVHHHGIGKARARWITDEYGTSFAMLETLKRAFDPNGIMNMGTIIPRS